jgi:hypothetical protein
VSERGNKQYFNLGPVRKWSIPWSEQWEHIQW